MGKYMWESLSRNWRSMTDLTILGLVLWAAFWFGQYMFTIAAPIVFGGMIYLMVRPGVRLLEKWKVKRSAGAAILITGSFLLSVGLVIGGTYMAGMQAKNVLESLPEYAAILKQKAEGPYDVLVKQYEDLPYGLPEKIGEQGKEMASAVLAQAEKMAFLFAGKLTGSFVFFGNVLMGMILAYFLSTEEKLLMRSLKRHTPDWAKEGWSFLHQHVMKGIGSYLKAQGKLILITFVVTLAGLSVFGVKNALLVALLAAFFDILPLLGVATVFLPWIAYLLLTGSSVLAIKLAAVYVTVFLLRQFLEPKLMGESMGVPAFVMLSLMILFYGLFGIWGMLLSPILTILLKELWQQGYLAKWIRTKKNA